MVRLLSGDMPGPDLLHERPAQAGWSFEEDRGLHQDARCGCIAGPETGFPTTQGRGLRNASGGAAAGSGVQGRDAAVLGTQRADGARSFGASACGRVADIGYAEGAGADCFSDACCRVSVS